MVKYCKTATRIPPQRLDDIKQSVGFFVLYYGKSLGTVKVADFVKEKGRGMEI